MADKKLNEVTKVTDMAYVPVIMEDGSIGQIAKADLVSVVAGLMPVNSQLGIYDGDLNALHKSAGEGVSCWTILGRAINAPFAGVGGLILNISRYNLENNLSAVIQIACGATNEFSNKIVCRTIHYDKSFGVEVVGDWKEITLK